MDNLSRKFVDTLYINGVWCPYKESNRTWPGSIVRLLCEHDLYWGLV